MDETKNENMDIMSVYMFVLTGQNPLDKWTRLLETKTQESKPEAVLQLWQALVQLSEEQVVSVVFQFSSPCHENMTRVILFTLEHGKLLVCNGFGSESLFVVPLEDVITWLNEWAYKEEGDVPIDAPKAFFSLFGCAPKSQMIYLLTETHDIAKNTNMRLAHFEALCKLSMFIV